MLGPGDVVRHVVGVLSEAGFDTLDGLCDITNITGRCTGELCKVVNQVLEPVI